MTQYEYCLICMETYKARGFISLAKAYEDLLNTMSIEKACAWI